jgi:hypothetical protein
MEDNSRVDMVGIVEVEKMVDIGVVGGSWSDGVGYGVKFMRVGMIIENLNWFFLRFIYVVNRSGYFRWEINLRILVIIFWEVIR